MTFFSNLVRSFEWHSSPVDWCEHNYEVTPYIAEFSNTISNIPFLIFGIHGVRTAINVDLGPLHLFAFSMLIVIGFSSAYFHATLSFAGQVFDELSILWTVSVSLAFQLVRKYGEEGYHYSQWDSPRRTVRSVTNQQLYLVTYSIAAIASVFVAYAPELNAPFLFVVGAGNVYYIYDAFKLATKTKKNSDAELLTSSYLISMSVFFLGVAAWITERVACDYVSQLQLHALWHICIAVSVHNGVTIATKFYFNHLHDVEFRFDWGIARLVKHKAK